VGEDPQQVVFEAIITIAIHLSNRVLEPVEEQGVGGLDAVGSGGLLDGQAEEGTLIVPHQTETITGVGVVELTATEIRRHGGTAVEAWFFFLGIRSEKMRWYVARGRSSLQTSSICSCQLVLGSSTLGEVRVNRRAIWVRSSSGASPPGPAARRERGQHRGECAPTGAPSTPVGF